MAGAFASHVLVLAGGSGTRLWPRSTEERPKPFLALASEKTLLRETVLRAADLTGMEYVYVSARASHRDLVLKELPEIPESRLILEPARRNTAPAIALSALVIADSDPDAVVVALPSDQAIGNEFLFREAVRTAIREAAAGRVFVTLGIRPTRPETGFGYMECGPDSEGAAVRRVLRFIEKPPLADAQRFAASGAFYWNAGIFVFLARLLIDEMDRLCPDVLASARASFEARRRGDTEGFARAFMSSRSVSLDTAVMERAGEVDTVPCDCGWTDLGSWDAVHEYRLARSGGESNVLSGPAICVDGSSNLILAQRRPIRVVGVSDIVVVDSPEGVLVMKRGASEALRKSVEKELDEVKLL